MYKTIIEMKIMTETIEITDPTRKLMAQFQKAYDFYNKELFVGELPPCLITLQRKSINVRGYYSPKRFGSNQSDETIDEIALNPQFFVGKDPTTPLSTLVHEMCHLWQFTSGQKKSRGGYHNKEWRDRMIASGLTPSSTGEPGGKMTGQKMTHYPTPNGSFLKATKKLRNRGFSIDWYEPDHMGKSAQTRFKFVCPECEDAAWGKEGLNISCDKCNQRMLIHKA